MVAQRVLLLVVYLLPALLLSEAAKILTISSLGECLAGGSGQACPRLLARSHANSPLSQRGFSYGFPGWACVLGWRRERLARVVGAERGLYYQGEIIDSPGEEEQFPILFFYLLWMRFPMGTAGARSFGLFLSLRPQAVSSTVPAGF